MKLNRISKPHQISNTNEEIETKYTTPKQSKLSKMFIPRLNRSACKEVGLSPNKLRSIMTESPDRRSSVSSPLKENLPLTNSCRKALKMDNGITKTPKIRIKKVPSGGSENDSTVWKVQHLCILDV